MPLIARELEKLKSSNARDQFIRIYKAVKALDADDYNSPYTRRVIDDVKRYMKTLTGEWKRHCIKDSFRIDERILVERLTAIDHILVAIKQNDIQAIQDACKDQLDQINYGKYPASNLKVILRTTDRQKDAFSRSPSVSMSASSSALFSAGSSSSQQKKKDRKMSELEAMCRCPITQDIMVDPVTAADGNSYERDALKEWYDGPNRTCPLVPSIELTDPSDMPTNIMLRDIIENLKPEVNHGLKK